MASIQKLISAPDRYTQILGGLDRASSGRVLIGDRHRVEQLRPDRIAFENRHPHHRAEREGHDDEAVDELLLAPEVHEDGGDQAGDECWR